MAAPRVGGLRTAGAREAEESAASAGAESDLSVPDQLNRKFKYTFQSRKSQFVVSLKRRKIHWDPQSGIKEEEVPQSADGNRLDMVRFTDHFFRTDDDEINAAFEALGKKKPEVFGIEGLCWRYEEKVAQQRTARAAEIRAALAADSELAKEVALTPSDKKDWDVKPKEAVPQVVPQTRVPKPAEEMTPEELEAATAPAPGSRTR